jgi:hypothetical protein
MRVLALALAGCLFAVTAHAIPMNKVAAGELVIDPPTLIKLGIFQSEGVFNVKTPNMFAAVIPNVTGGHSGNAPGLGALESGQPMPHYGPRSSKSGFKNL